MPEVPEHFAKIHFQRAALVFRLRHFVAEHLVCLLRLFQAGTKFALVGPGAMLRSLGARADLDEFLLCRLRTSAGLSKLLSKLLGPNLGLPAMFALAG